eukprot:gene29291-38363_t
MYVSCLRYLKAGVRNAASKSGALKNIIESQSSTARNTTRKFLAVPFEISSTRALHTIGNYKRSRSLKFIEQRRCLSTVPEISKLLMPSLSPTMTKGTIAAWNKVAGDSLKAGDVLCEIVTDKASVDFEVQDDVVLAKILVPAQGEELACGEPIALIVEDLAAYTQFLALDPGSYATAPTGVAPAAEAVAAAVTPVSSSLPSPTQRFSPAARHRIASAGLSSAQLVGTAKHGIITKSDVVKAQLAGTLSTATNSSLTLSPSPLPSAAIPSPVTTTPAAVAAKPTATPAAVEPANERYVDIPNSNMRKVIARRLTESKSTVPHLYMSVECEIDELLNLRKTLKKDLDVTVSVNDLVIKSAALALRDTPRVISRWNTATQSVQDGQGKVDISVAVATPNGLITPIVTRSDQRGLADIGKTVKDLAGRARDGKLKPEEYQGGSFSISNLGMFGISTFSAVINPPQACILAVGAGIRKVLPPKIAGPGQSPRVSTTVTAQLSADRRVVDEATAAQFLQVFQTYLSDPKTLLL